METTTQARADEDSFFPKWMGQFEGRLAFDAGEARVGNIPRRYQLKSQLSNPSQVGGETLGISLGVGFSFTGANWLEIFLDLNSKGSMGPVSFMWGGADGYGYPYHEYASRLSAKLIPFPDPFTLFGKESPLVSQIYLKVGVQEAYSSLALGTSIADYVGGFNTQATWTNAVPSGVFGGGLLVGFLSAEYLHSASFAGNMSVTENMFLFSFDVCWRIKHNREPNP